jgi:hypothetical protein
MQIKRQLYLRNPIEYYSSKDYSELVQVTATEITKFDTFPNNDDDYVNSNMLDLHASTLFGLHASTFASSTYLSISYKLISTSDATF